MVTDAVGHQDQRRAEGKALPSGRGTAQGKGRGAWKRPTPVCTDAERTELYMRFKNYGGLDSSKKVRLNREPASGGWVESSGAAHSPFRPTASRIYRCSHSRKRRLALPQTLWSTLPPQSTHQTTAPHQQVVYKNKEPRRANTLAQRAYYKARRGEII